MEIATPSARDLDGLCETLEPADLFSREDAGPVHPF